MDINRNNPDGWNADIEASVQHYNNWFVRYAPPTFRKVREQSFAMVNKALSALGSMCDLDDDILIESPDVLTILRQMTCPPLARERLAGLAGVASSVVKSFEDGTAKQSTRAENAAKIMEVIRDLIDTDLLSWIDTSKAPTKEESDLAAYVISDRLCGALTDPQIRNEQERRQICAITDYLEHKGYTEARPRTYKELNPGEYAIHLNVAVKVGEDQTKNLAGDVTILPRRGKTGDLPIFIEAKSAGDFTNVNKRRKEEASKARQLQETYGDVRYVLFLGGYFDRGYLDYEAANGIDWIWEHRVADMEKLGL